MNSNLQRGSFSNAKSEKKKAALEIIVGRNSEEFQKTITFATYALFERVPIYNLNNAGYKGSLASLALKDVKFSEGYATVTLSPVQALLRALAILGLILLVLTNFLGRFIIGRWIEKGLDRLESKPN